MSPHTGENVDVHDAIAVRFDGGATGSVSGASFQNGCQGNLHQCEIRVFGSHGHLHADLERERLWIWRADEDPTPVALPIDSGPYECRGPVHTLLDLAQAKDFINRSPIELGARTVELLDAACVSMSSGLSVNLRS